MKRLCFLVAAALSIPLCANAADALCQGNGCTNIDASPAFIFTQTDTHISDVFPLVITTQPDSYRVFEMKEGGCLRGPLAFLMPDGHDLFRLTKGATYPTGCDIPTGK